LAVLFKCAYVVVVQGKGYNIKPLLGGTVGNFYGEVTFTCYKAQLGALGGWSLR
jgi:hypothetical protein